MDNKDLLALLDFFHQAELLKGVLRHSWLSSGRRESVAEHSWRMALMAIVLAPKVNPNLDMTKLLKIIALHDLAEVYAGDPWAFNKKSLDKEVKELSSMQKLLAGLPEELRDDLLSIWQEYEEISSEEAKLAKALDKLEVLIQHNEAKIKTWNKKEFALNFVHGDEYCLYSETLWKLKELVKDESWQKILKEYT